MNTRYTPVHGNLWHKDFIILALSELFLTISVYMQLPVFFKNFFCHRLFQVDDLGLAIGVYGLGLYVLGPFCAWLTHRFRRNRVYMISSGCLLLVFAFASLYGDVVTMSCLRLALWCVSLLFGAFYGMSKRVLTGILLIDKSESHLRTQANSCSAWISRFSLGLGPALSLFVLNYLKDIDITLIVIILMLLSICFVRLVKFPFKTPDEDIRFLSYDRFFMWSSWKYFLMMALLSVCIGLILTLHHGRALFYVMFVPGFIVAILTENMFDKEKRGIIHKIILCIPLLCVGIFIMLNAKYGSTIYCLASFFIGMALEYVGSHILNMFINASMHCQRSTAISTYFLASESGMAFGVCMGCLFYEKIEQILLFVILSIVLTAAVVSRNVWTVTDKR